MSIRTTPYLVMDGNAKEAIQFYKQVMNAEVQSITTYADMPMPFSDEVKDRVAHAVLKIGETELMFSDSPGIPIQTGNQVTICITSTDIAKTKQIFEALQQEGKVNAPLEETPFSPAFGNVTDKFGVTFQIVTDHQN